jgi:ring-1,2-phenylacetyl-CoA epoxidase subunit PaaE
MILLESLFQRSEVDRCQFFLRELIPIFAANPDQMTPKFHSLTIREVRRETEDTVSIAFDVPEELKPDFSYLSGQYLTLKTSIKGEDVRRSYSLCSSPFEKEWRVAIKKIPNGLFSTFAFEQLNVGDRLEVMTPAGNFRLQTEIGNSKNYVLFAAGSGITPILSIAKTALKEEQASTVTLFYGNKNFNTIIFRERLEALKNAYMDRLRVIHILSRERLGYDIQKGRIDRAKADHLYKTFLEGENIDAVYICGPEEMILGVKDSMIVNGVDPNRVHFELFTTANKKAIQEETIPDVSNISANVSVIVDGDRFDLLLESSGTAVLDAAQKVGADLPFACKGGVCCTCKAKILEGSARMDVNYALEKNEVEAGYILTCQAHPTSERLIISFDE